MPTPLRLFASIKISNTKILFLGGAEKVNKETDSVYCFDNEDGIAKIEKLDKIPQAGIITYPVVVDKVGNLHLFMDKNCDTAPPTDVVYSFLEYS